MKSFAPYSSDLETLLFPPLDNNISSGRLIAHYELYKKVAHLNGSVVKCGITLEEGFRRFITFKDLAGHQLNQKLIAFEKIQPLFKEIIEEGELTIKIQPREAANLEEIAKSLKESGPKQNIDFVPGSVSETIPLYLMENPELKIAFLNIDLDDYETTLTALEFLYPRVIPGGVLILDNYYKYCGDHLALKHYFSNSSVTINNYSVNNGPHYVVKD